MRNWLGNPNYFRGEVQASSYKSLCVPILNAYLAADSRNNGCENNLIFDEVILK